RYHLPVTLVVRWSVLPSV
ncbi:hypothetical protein D030_4511B, partial [Vibrio parahaemolyticus AQ3810]